MKFRYSLFLPLLFVFAGLFISSADAGDPAAGKQKAQQSCQTCHGLNGVGLSPMIANISGQKEFYIISQLQAFRSGKRQHQQMSIIAGMLKDKDIEDLAAWYSGLKVTVEAPQ